jgi:hypothetical protein
LRLLVRMTLPSIREGRKWLENYATFECVVHRLRGPIHSVRRGKPSTDWIYADIDVPPQYMEYTLPEMFNADGTYPVEVPINYNRNSTRAFLASGDVEWDVRESA